MGRGATLKISSSKVLPCSLKSAKGKAQGWADLLWDTFHGTPTETRCTSVCLLSNYGHDNGVGPRASRCPRPSSPVGQCDLEVHAEGRLFQLKDGEASASANSGGGSSEKETRNFAVTIAGALRKNATHKPGSFS